MIARLKPVAMKSARERLGMTKAQLARVTGMQAGTITWIECGRFVPYESQLTKIAEALGVEEPESLLEPIEVA